MKRAFLLTILMVIMFSSNTQAEAIKAVIDCNIVKHNTVYYGSCAKYRGDGQTTTYMSFEERARKDTGHSDAIVVGVDYLGNRLFVSWKDEPTNVLKLQVNEQPDNNLINVQ